MSFENPVGKREICRYEQFLLFPNGFYPFREHFIIFVIPSQFERVKFVVLERVNASVKKHRPISAQGKQSVKLTVLPPTGNVREPMHNEWTSIACKFDCFETI